MDQGPPRAARASATSHAHGGKSPASYFASTAMSERSARVALNTRGEAENLVKPKKAFETCCYERLLDDQFGGDSGKHGAGHFEEALRRDAELVYPYDAETFWLPAGAKPTTLLEKLVKSIFDFHTKDNPQQRCHQDQHLSSDATPRSHLSPESSDDVKHAPASLAGKKRRRGNSSACGLPRGATLNNDRQGGFPETDNSDAESGAEWWVQVREEGHHSHLGMPFHWDKDEKLMEEKGVVVCPSISTVTYLTDFGAPTAVLELCATGATGSTARATVREGGCDRAFLSYPALFKHLAFDGSFLHGVPEPMQREGRPNEKDYGRPANRLGGGDIERDSSPVASFCDKTGPRDAGGTGPGPARERQRGRMRVTLLVNVWLSHKPSGMARLPADIAANLSGGEGLPSLCFERLVAFPPVPVDWAPLGCGDASVGVEREKNPPEATIELEGPLGPTSLLTVRYPTPERLSTGDRKWLHSFALSYGKGCYPSISCSPARPGLEPEG